MEYGNFPLNKNLRMILVLLYKFEESQESLLGFQLCRRLVQEGHDLLVTTTSTEECLKNEVQRAKELSESTPGSITLVPPEYLELEEPSIDWIANTSRHYFGQLYDNSDVDTIIGMLPGTTQTAVYLKEELKCKLVLLGITKIQSEDQSMENEFILAANRADEIWSVGPDTYHHYQAILDEKGVQSCVSHKEILLKPQVTDFVPDFVEEIKEQPILEIVSMWNQPVAFFHKGKKMQYKGSGIDSFSSLGAALGKVNSEVDQQYNMKWSVFGLKFTDIISSIEHIANENRLTLRALEEVLQIQNLNWNKGSAFIVPDVQDESFNFIALCTIWLGIPTLVSSQSSIGKFLSQLPCPVAGVCSFC